MKHIKESGMGDVYAMAFDAGSFNKFYKELVVDMKNNPNAKDFKEDAEFKKWAKYIYDDALDMMEEKEKFQNIFDAFLYEQTLTDPFKPGVVLNLGGRVGIITEITQVHNGVVQEFAFRGIDNVIYNAKNNGHQFIIAGVIEPEPGI